MRVFSEAPSESGVGSSVDDVRMSGLSLEDEGDDERGDGSDMERQSPASPMNAVGESEMGAAGEPGETDEVFQQR